MSEIKLSKPVVTGPHLNQPAWLRWVNPGTFIINSRCEKLIKKSGVIVISVISYLYILEV